MKKAELTSLLIQLYSIQFKFSIVKVFNSFLNITSKWFNICFRELIRGNLFHFTQQLVNHSYSHSFHPIYRRSQEWVIKPLKGRPRKNLFSEHLFRYWASWLYRFKFLMARYESFCTYGHSLIFFLFVYETSSPWGVSKEYHKCWVDEIWLELIPKSASQKRSL